MSSSVLEELKSSKSVPPRYGKMAGLLLFVGAAQFVVGLILAQARHPGYNVSENFISDLGIGPAAVIFNLSVFVLGVMGVLSAYFVQRSIRKPLVAAFLGLTGLGAMGVGLFPEAGVFGGLAHTVSSLVTFLFAALWAIASYTLRRPPLTYFSVVLGIFSLAALTLFATRNYLGLGQGGMELMIVYPVMIWAIAFGGYLMNHSEE